MNSAGMSTEGYRRVRLEPFEKLRRRQRLHPRDSELDRQRWKSRRAQIFATAPLVAKSDRAPCPSTTRGSGRIRLVHCRWPDTQHECRRPSVRSAFLVSRRAHCGRLSAEAASCAHTPRVRVGRPGGNRGPSEDPVSARKMRPLRRSRRKRCARSSGRYDTPGKALYSRYSSSVAAPALARLRRRRSRSRHRLLLRQFLYRPR